MLLRSAVQRQRGSAAGIFALVFLLAACLCTAGTVYLSGTDSVAGEMARLGYGYEINGQYSDDEGQLLLADGAVPYRFVTEQGEKMETPEIQPGTVYISPALRSTFDVSVGDTIHFELSRSEEPVSLTVAGCFADAFMGSSMIDMKSFLISAADWNAMRDQIRQASQADALGRVGDMVHIFQRADSPLEPLDFRREVSESTDIALYTAFSYQRESILSYMLLLQNILAGVCFAFSGVLLILCLVVLGHVLSVIVEQDREDIASLKSMGQSGAGIRGVYLALYGGVILLALLLGLAASQGISRLLASAMVSSTGMRISIRFPAAALIPALLGIAALFTLFLTARTAQVLRIPPVQAMRETAGERAAHTPLRKKTLGLDIAWRELCSNRRKYVALGLIAGFLALFLSVIGKMGTWLGPNGEGLMNAFSVADHDLGVQPFNDSVPMDEIERVIQWYSPVRETYELAMQSVTVDGQEYTANVLDDTRWFHVLAGEVCDGDSILITDTVASELGLSIGDSVQVAANGRMGTYRVSGLYQCANGMGSNIGMSIQGYSQIGDITGYIWCYHYILENGAVRDYAMAYLQDHYKGVDVHTNSWSGLDGIVFVMHALIAVLYLIAAVCILIAVALAAGKLLQFETGKMAIYKSMGLSAGRIRLSFALRFLIVVSIGTAAGIGVSLLCGDALIGSLFRSFGIGEFVVGFSLLGTVLPALAVPLLFFIFALAFSARLKQVSIVSLLSESDL